MKKKIVVMVVGGGNTPSGDITIDDVVKFIHDDLVKINPNIFPYTTWDAIPDYDDAEDGQICKTDKPKKLDNIILSIPHYTIGSTSGPS